MAPGVGWRRILATRPGLSAVDFHSDDLIALFAAEFGAEYRTRLVAGGEEPLYRPAATADGWNEIVFRHDWFQSALHEIAHWCIAGAERRRQADFGYWYAPDGRTGAQQGEFERVEARPQAVEWVLTAACGKPFRVSMDNLDSDDPLDEGSLWRAVHREVSRCVAGALPPRAARFARALAEHYGQPWPLPVERFALPAAVAGATTADYFDGKNRV